MTFQHGVSSSRIVPILARCSLRLRPRKLQLVFDTGTEGSLANVVDLLREAGPSLERLDMFVMQRRTLEFFEPGTLLASNTGLRVLHMRDSAIRVPHAEGEEASFLSRIIPLHWMARTIALTVRILGTSSDWLDTAADSLQLDWSVLDAELARAADYHPGVEIGISARYPEDLDEWADVMEKVVLMRLPLMRQKRCRLRVTCFRDWAVFDEGLGGYAAGPCHTTWHECPLAAQMNPPVVQVVHIPICTSPFLSSLFMQSLKKIACNELGYLVLY